MLCEKCKKNEATFYYHENINGSEKTYHLCTECADEMEKKGEIGHTGMDKTFEGLDSFFSDGIFGDPFKSMNNLLAGFFGNGVKQVQSAEKKCPDCGLTFREFAANGMAGCPKCYETFAKELEPTLTRVHGRSSHNGRVPSKFREKADMKRKIESLEAEQQNAIQNENYERAAEIRDELKRLRGAASGEASAEA